MFHAGSLGSNNFQNSRKNDRFGSCFQTIFPFYMTMIAWRCHGISRVYFYFLFRTSVKKYYMDERDLRHCCGIFSEKVILKITWLQLFGSSRLKMFLRKGVLKICSKFTGKHPCQSVIAIKLFCNFIEVTLRHGCSLVNFLLVFISLFSKNTFGWLLLYAQSFFSIIKRHIYNKLLKDKLQLRILRTWIKICANSFINTSLNIMKQNSTKVLGNLSLKKKYDPTFQRTLHQDSWY